MLRQISPRLSPDEATAPIATAATTAPSPMRNAFSVDVEDYFQVSAFEDAVPRDRWGAHEPRVERNTRQLLDLCAEQNVRGTFFVLGWVAERFPRLLRDIQAAGHELGTHGSDHRRVTTLTPPQFRHDVRRAKQSVEQATGAEVVGYRAPSYSIVRETLWAMDVLLEEGFRYDSSIFPIHHDRYGIPSYPRFPWAVRARAGRALLEFPISTLRLGPLNLPFVGGGYLRQLPLAFVRWGLRRLNEVERRPAILYVHPWEIDPDQPRVPVSALTRVRHYRNLAATEHRLRQLMREFSFTTVREVLAV